MPQACLLYYLQMIQHFTTVNTPLILSTNIELDKAKSWFETNKLTLNVSKTKFIVFKKPNQTIDMSGLKLKIGSELLERLGQDCEKKCYKFVGLNIDDTLSWEQHIHYVHKKLSSANYIINSAKNILPKNIRLTVYNSLFKSHLQYGILAWGKVPNTKLQKIISVQKKCIRNVANKDFRSHTEPLFSQMKVMKFQDILEYESLLYMHKYVYARLPDSLLNMFTPLKTNGRNGNYLLKRYKGKYLDRFTSSYLPKILNQVSIM